MSTPIDTELANLLDMGEIIDLVEHAVRQITALQLRVARAEEARAAEAAGIAGLQGRVAMLEAVAPPWADAGARS